MEKNNLWVLLGKQFNGEITEKERKILQKSLQENDRDLSYLIEFLEHAWGEHRPFRNDFDNARLNERWERLSERLFIEDEIHPKGPLPFFEDKTKPRNKVFSLWYSIAAAVVLLIGISVYFMINRQAPASGALHEIIVKNGMRRHVKLPDGTTVWLNADSKLSYYNGFGDNSREVWLEGEALFNVRKDASIPFMVKTPGVTIRVLGTVFNVKAYKNEPDIQTTLISGKVQVSLDNDPEKKIVLSPREKLTVMSGNHAAAGTVDSSGDEAVKNKVLPVISKVNKLKYQVQTLPVNPADSSYFTETAWVENKLAFVDEPFSEVAKQMERRYNVHIIFRDNALKEVVMSGVFDKETVGEALHVLQMITRFQYQTVGDSIYLYK